MRMKSQRLTRSRGALTQSRTGFTMAETLVVLVLLAIVGGSLMSVLTKQQQFYNGTGDLIQLRTQLRQAEAILGGDLRGISSVGGDITAMTDSSIDFNYTIGTSVACKAPNSGNTIVIPPTGALTNGNTLTSWIAQPALGDTAYVFDDSTNTNQSTDDVWQAYTVASLSIGSGSCDGGFNAATANTLLLVTTVSPTILDGAAIRFIRRAHYSLYKSPNDTLWYLGYCSPACSVSNPINPIAGPFQPYVASTVNDASGIRMTYYDSTVRSPRRPRRSRASPSRFVDRRPATSTSRA